MSHHFLVTSACIIIFTTIYYCSYAIFLFNINTLLTIIIIKGLTWLNRISGRRIKTKILTSEIKKTKANLRSTTANIGLISFYRYPQQRLKTTPTPPVYIVRNIEMTNPQYYHRMVPTAPVISHKPHRVIVQKPRHPNHPVYMERRQIPLYQYPRAYYVPKPNEQPIKHYYGNHGNYDHHGFTNSTLESSVSSPRFVNDCQKLLCHKLS